MIPSPARARRPSTGHAIQSSVTTAVVRTGTNSRASEVATSPSTTTPTTPAAMSPALLTPASVTPRRLAAMALDRYATGKRRRSRRYP